MLQVVKIMVQCFPLCTLSNWYGNYFMTALSFPLYEQSPSLQLNIRTLHIFTRNLISFQSYSPRHLVMLNFPVCLKILLFSADPYYLLHFENLHSICLFHPETKISDA